MLDTLTPLHVALEKGPQTTSEASFQQAFGAELLAAHGRCEAYVRNQERAELAAAWDIYYHVFRRISKQIAKLAVLELTHVSPKLLEAQHPNPNPNPNRDPNLNRNPNPKPQP